VYCQKSDRDPKDLELKSIEYAAHQCSLQAETPDELAMTLNASELHCSYHSYLDGNLILTTKWISSTRALVRFGKRHLIKMPQKITELRIPYEGIVELVWGSNTGGYLCDAAMVPDHHFIRARQPDDPGNSKLEH